MNDGVPLEGLTCFCVDNMSVVNNTTIPASTLKKKSNSIAYHFVREKIAARVGYVIYEPTETNLADIGQARTRIKAYTTCFDDFALSPEVAL